MTSTPPRLNDSSFDASDVATPITIIERIRIRDDDPDDGNSNDEDFENKSQSSAQFSQASEATTTVKQPFPQTTTKVYCHIDDEPTQYLMEVHVPPDLITLGDVKRVLMRTNFKYYCKALDPDSGYEVKAEVRDDAQLLSPLPNGRFELFLLTVEGSTHSDGSSGKLRKHNMVPAPAPSNSKHMPMNYHHAAYQLDNSMMSTDSESVFSAVVPTYLKNAYARRFPHYMGGHRRNVEESTIGSESDARIFSDDDDRGSTTTDFTSVSRQHEKMAKKRNKKKNFRKPSRASSFSSITESSMSLDVITVTLNMDTVNFLGISIVGQTSTRGDNGIYVANIMKGGAVALDGRIEAGDMILQVNETSFENFTNDQAVDVLREAVSRRGPIKLTVAKSFENAPQSCFTIPRNSREEPVRPIDTQAWIQHTNAMRGMPSIIEESAPTPIPGEWPHGRPQSSSTVTSGSNGQNTVVGGVPNGGGHIQLDIHTDKKKVVEVMAMPGSGLDIKNRTWLKIPIPMSFLGSDLVEWLLDHVEGLRERKDARKYAADLLKLKYIAHVVNKITFTEQCYYVLGDECSEYTRFRNEDGGPKYQWTNAMNGMSANGPMGSQGPLYGNKAMAPSMVSGYASMPVSPYPNPIKREDQKSQASGSSGASARMRSVILPSKPASIGSGGGNEDFHDMAVSRQSFRAAMNHPYEFLIDKI